MYWYVMDSVNLLKVACDMNHPPGVGYFSGKACTVNGGLSYP